MQVAIRLIERGNDLFLNNELNLYELTLCTLSHTILNNVKRSDKTQSSIASFIGGRRGIRTPGSFHFNGFQVPTVDLFLPLVAYRYCYIFAKNQA